MPSGKALFEFVEIFCCKIQNCLLCCIRLSQPRTHKLKLGQMHWCCLKWSESGVHMWGFHAAAAAKSLQLCLTLCDPTDGSPLGSAISGILQARTLEWVAIAFSNAWKWKVKVKSLSPVWLFATPWTATYQAPPSMGFSRQECWSGVPLPWRRAEHQPKQYNHKQYQPWWNSFQKMFLQTWKQEQSLKSQLQLKTSPVAQG